MVLHFQQNINTNTGKIEVYENRLKVVKMCKVRWIIQRNT